MSGKFPFVMQPKYLLSVMTSISLLSGLGVLSIKVDQSQGNILTKIVDSYNGKVFVEATRYCFLRPFNATVAQSTTNNQTQVDITVRSSEQYISVNSPYTYIWDPQRFAYGDHEIRFDQPKNGTLELISNYTTNSFYSGFLQRPVAHPQYTIRYRPDPGFSGTENFNYYLRQSAVGTRGTYPNATDYLCFDKAPITINVTPTAPSCTNPETYDLATGAGIFSVSYDPNLTNNRGVASVPTASLYCVSATNSDLTIEKTISGELISGNQATYTLNVTNVGPNNNPGPITVTDTLPPQLSFVSATGTGWSCSQASQVITCTKADGLNVGASSQIAVVVNVTG